MEKKLEALLVRALKTFFQGFVASFTYGITATSTSNSSAAYRALFVGAIAAGVSAVMNLFIQPTTK